MSQHPRRQAFAGYLAGYGPWHEHPLAHRPLLRTTRAPFHLPGAGRGHAQSKESSVEPALLPIVETKASGIARSIVPAVNTRYPTCVSTGAPTAVSGDQKGDT